MVRLFWWEFFGRIVLVGMLWLDCFSGNALVGSFWWECFGRIVLVGMFW